MELKEREREVEYKASVDDSGKVVLKKKKKIERGKSSRQRGGSFESRVRKDLMDKGWIVDKWSNNVSLEEEKVVPAKRKFNPFSKVMTIGTGFPDFIAFQLFNEGNKLYKLVGVECKVSGKLSKEEKEKCVFLLKEKVFSEIWVAKKVKEKNRVSVVYENFEEIEKRMR